MPLLTDPDQLSQGTNNAVADLRFSGAAGNAVSLDSAGAGLPVVSNDMYIVVRNAIDTNNNGLYRVADVAPSTTQIDVVKITGANPTNSAVDNTAAAILGDNTLAANIFFDTSARLIYLLEQNGLDASGVTKNAIYSFTKEEFKDDNFLKKFPFPMFAIDLDAGKYRVGTDGASFNGWAYADDNSVDGLIRTKKLIRSGGWEQLNSNGNVILVATNITTLGTFEDEANDTAYGVYGTAVDTNNSFDFDFAGPVNEAIFPYVEVGNPHTFTFVDGGAGSDTVTRATGSFITDGFVVGGKMVVRNATVSANNGTYTITGVAATTLTFATASFNTAGADSAAIIAVDNRDNFAIRLRVRDGDANGKTYDESNLNAIGRTALSNFIFAFPLSNSTDLNISETDVNIDGNAPYTGMTITYYATPQSQAGLVGGSFDYGIVIDANGGTTTQVYEWVQRQLRKTSDIDNDADNKIGRMMGDLLAFEGDILVSGSQQSPNPDGGGTGVFITNINAANQNDLRMVDNTGVRRQFPETIAITIDVNDALINDTVAEFTLWYDRTIRTSVADFVISGATGPNATITSAGTNLPNNAELSVGDYIRVAGLTGNNVAANGIYQITTETTPGASWAVTRYDGADAINVTATTANVDQNPIDSPDAIIVQDNTPVDIAGLATSDQAFNYDFDGNVQGGRVVSTDTFVVGRGIGLQTAQFVQSGVLTISSGTPLTVPLSSANELNYVT